MLMLERFHYFAMLDTCAHYARLCALYYDAMPLRAYAFSRYAHDVMSAQR